MLTEQINLLTNDASQHSKELVILKREHTSQLIDMQNRLQHKQEEVSNLLEMNLKKEKILLLFSCHIYYVVMINRLEHYWKMRKTTGSK